MISNKHKLSLILSMLLLSCSLWDEDSESTINSLVGTWNVTTYKYFSANLDCSGVPESELVVDSLEQIAEYGLDEYQLKLTITIDSYIIAINTLSTDTSFVREEIISTGIWKEINDQFCIIWDMGDGDDFWISGGGDGCDACRDYTINDDEFKMTAYNCPIPPFPDMNVPCQISTFVKN